MDTKPLTVSVEAARKMLGIGITKAYELLNSGELRSIKLGRKRLILVTSIHELIERNAT